MGTIASQITCLTIVYSTVYSRADQIKHKKRITGLCVGNSPVAAEYPAQMASNAEMFPLDDVVMLFLNVHCSADCLQYVDLIK